MLATSETDAGVWAPRRVDPATAADNQPVLFALENVSYSRDGRSVLAELGIELDAGATALVGPSGAGKSTMLRLLNRLADPEEGIVRYRAVTYATTTFSRCSARSRSSSVSPSDPRSGYLSASSSV